MMKKNNNVLYLKKLKFNSVYVYIMNYEFP
jgi:hypothetical protein